MYVLKFKSSGYQAGLPAVAELCEQTDDKLFRALIYKLYNPIHPLHRLLSPKRSKPYITCT